MDKQLAVGYGILDMRAGQQLLEAWHQVNKLKEEQPGIKVWYFDIVHTPNQTPKALQWLDKVRTMIHETTNIDGSKINVRLNTNTKVLQARNDLYKTAYERKITSVDQRIVT